ncbi:hypothetical protein LuPra_02464 [Luteitalea pratensis]|uniref:SnoaL-like domain-containing protein n=1 Tax=Luteitalea pratensis TaxID=1855912 RepID=A0A143PL78_LUTPR|nr:nuclear transport factor 2 family protein [Luteitalea pratensis]AMY09251.1 hypothetical protein LuPra_02464 [Luteitalea pratensis]
MIRRRDVGPVQVDVRQQDADGSCHGIASHHLAGAPGGDTRVFFGSYHVHLTKRDGTWRIDGFRYALNYIQGNVNLGQRA